MPEPGASIFESLVVSPAETYADHMVLAGGFTEFEAAEQAKTPWIAHGMNGYHLGVEIDYMTKFAQDTFLYFGGTAISRVVTFSTQELIDYLEDWDNQNRFGVYDNPDILPTVNRYLTGQANNEACEQLVNFP